MKTPIMALRNFDPNFKEVFVAQNNDGTMSFIFMIKSP